MRKDNMQSLPFPCSRVAMLGVLMGLAISAAGCNKPVASTALVSDGNIDEGSPTAKVTVVEYASVACPFCARVNHDIMPTFMAKYVVPGKVHYIYRPMMTGNPSVATAGHLLAQCAGKEKALKVIDAIMRSQDEMNKGGAPEQYANARPVLLTIAQSVGISEEQFDKCIQDPKGILVLNNINDEALKAGVASTPTFFVNDKQMELKKGDISDFDAAIQPVLK